jgi:hypothetical protein
LTVLSRGRQVRPSWFFPILFLHLHKPFCCQTKYLEYKNKAIAGAIANHSKVCAKISAVQTPSTSITHVNWFSIFFNYIANSAPFFLTSWKTIFSVCQSNQWPLSESFSRTVSSQDLVQGCQLPTSKKSANQGQKRVNFAQKECVIKLA